MTLFTRTYALEDVSIRSAAQGGDGRTVDAYCAVFDTPAEVNNRTEGNFNEVIRRGAFKKTLEQNRDKLIVLFNHGKTLYGTPSERFAMTLGKCIDAREDQRGVFTSTRYNRSTLADEVLAGIENDEITGQSFTGSFVRSDPLTRGAIRSKPDGTLATVTRTEISMREYGPSIIPVYKDAAIVGVRAEEIADLLVNLDPALRAELLQIISETSTRPHGAPLPAERSDAALPQESTSGDPAALAAELAAQSWAVVRRALHLKGIKP
jgi:HK97 family phage prohead protease